MVERAKPVARPAAPGPAGKGRDIAFVGVRAQTDRLRAELERRVAAGVDHGQFILGPEVAELEGQLARFSGARHALAVSNGTDALLMALMAEGIGPGDAVFVPAFTFAATAEVVVLAGATPVFVDVEEGSYNLDPAALRKKAGAVADSGTLRARAVIPVDLFGLPADYDAIAAVARDFDMFVIADAAQSFG
ncbi:MAG: aminotransferase class I/II-fold pyridoxal phosphate-dependent enzyme, partial [Alphaproteobacteria bacterium]